MRRHRDQVFAGGWEPIVDLATFYTLAEAPAASEGEGECVSDVAAEED